MRDRTAIYLLEAYAAPAGVGPASADALRAEIEAHDGVRVIGLLGVPVDEAILCLVAAESPAAEAAVAALADRYGPAARLLRVSWAPTEILAEGAAEASA
jgi:hypothetical protein